MNFKTYIKYQINNKKLNQYNKPSQKKMESYSFGNDQKQQNRSNISIQRTQQQSIIKPQQQNSNLNYSYRNSQIQRGDPMNAPKNVNFTSNQRGDPMNLQNNGNFSQIQRGEYMNSQKSGVFNKNISGISRGSREKLNLSQLDLSNTKVDKLKHENWELKKKVHRLEKLNAGWSGKKSKSNFDVNYEKEFLVLKQQLKISNEKIFVLENENVNLKNNIKKIQFEKEALENYNKKLTIETNKVNINNTTENINIERNFNTKLKNLETTIENLEKNNKYLQSENLRIQNLNEEKSNSGKNRYLESSLRETNLMVGNLQNENQKLRSHFETEKIKNFQIYQNRLKTFEIEKEELQQKIKILEISLNSKIPEKIKYKEDLSSKRMLELYSKKLEEKISEIKNLRSENQNLKNLNQNLKFEINEKNIISNFENSEKKLKNQTNHEIDLIKLDYENLENINKGLKIENHKLRKNIKELNNSTNTTTVTENVIYNTNSGLGKKNTEDLIIKYLLLNFEMERNKRFEKENGFFEKNDTFGKFKY